MAKFYRYSDGTFKPVGRGKPPRDAVVVELTETPANIRVVETPKIEPQATIQAPVVVQPQASDVVPLAETVPRYTTSKVWIMEYGQPLKELTKEEIAKL